MRFGGDFGGPDDGFGQLHPDDPSVWIEVWSETRTTAEGVVGPLHEMDFTPVTLARAIWPSAAK